MSIRKGKEKTQQTLAMNHQYLPYNIYLNPTPPDTQKIALIQGARSLSKGKHKTKARLFQATNNRFGERNSPFQKELLKSYSSFGTLSNETPKTKTSVRQYLAKKNALLSNECSRPAKEEPEEQKKIKREFKLIHQIKSDKAKEKNKRAVEKVTKVEAGPIEAGTHQKIDDFAEEIDLILNPIAQQEMPKASLSKWSEKQEEPSSSQLRQNLPTLYEAQKRQNSGQSVIQMNLPSKLFQSQERPQLAVRKISEEEQKLPDLSRSFSKASQLLKRRKDSSSSIDVSLRESKVRAEISLSLALESNHASRIDLSAFYKEIQGNYGGKEKVTCRDKINAHLQILHSMSHFVYESIKFDEIGDEWEELNFLIYKKYYIERRKVLNFIQKYPMRNPFCIYNAEISSKEIIQFMKTEEGNALLADLRKETAVIKEKLGSIYAQFDKAKVGEKINLYEYDNFSHWIIQELWAELILTEHNTSHTQQEIAIRLCRILQLIFLISELNGKYECSFEEAEAAIADNAYNQYIKEGKNIFQKYILYQEVEDDPEEDQ